MERFARVRSPEISGFPGAVVTTGEEIVLGIIHAFLTVVLLTATSIIVFNPVLFQNSALVAVIGGIALIDLLISHKTRHGG